MYHLHDATHSSAGDIFLLSLTYELSREQFSSELIYFEEEIPVWAFLCQGTPHSIRKAAWSPWRKPCRGEILNVSYIEREEINLWNMHEWKLKYASAWTLEKQLTETNIFSRALYKVNLKKNIDWSESLLIYIIMFGSKLFKKCNLIIHACIIYISLYVYI